MHLNVFMVVLLLMGTKKPAGGAGAWGEPLGLSQGLSQGWSGLVSVARCAAELFTPDDFDFKQHHAALFALGH
jgi:hypothetical protein